MLKCLWRLVCFVPLMGRSSTRKNTLISNFGAWYQTSLFNVTGIKELVEGSSGNMSTTKKNKLCGTAHKVNGTEWIHILLPITIAPRQVQPIFPDMQTLAKELDQKKPQKQHCGTIYQRLHHLRLPF